MNAVRLLTLMLMVSFSPVLAQAEEAHHEEAASGGLPQFDPTWFASQVFWLVIAFAVVLGVFSKVILPKLTTVLEDRRKHIESDMKLAETLAAQAEAVKTAYEDGLRKAGEEAGKIVQQVEDAAHAKATAQYSEFRTRFEQEVKSAEGKIDTAKQNAMQDMSKIAAEIASEAAQKIVGISTDLNQAQTVVASLQKKAKAA